MNDLIEKTDQAIQSEEMGTGTNTSDIYLSDTNE
jgi:hypothetical protein